MTRRRSISCPTCGFLQLKRDAYCDKCGRVTVIESRRLTLALVTALVTLIVFGITYARMTGFVAAFGH